MSTTRRDFLKNSGMVVMAGAAGYFGFEQLVQAAETAQRLGVSGSTDYDRQRWGTTSRDRYVAAVRSQYLDGA